MSDAPGLVVELWYATAPDLTDPAVLAGLRAISPGTEVQRDSLAVPYTGDEMSSDSLAPQLGGQAPLLSAVLPGSALGQDGKTLPDVSQTWDWTGAEQALDQARTSVLVTEMLGEGHVARDRVAALTSVVAALASATSPVAVSWPTSQRVTDPAAALDGVGGLLNVRLFSVSGDEDELVMDTLGLAPFGLPDMQCHFRDLEPAALAGVLFSAASYLLEAGDVIGNGETISGPQGDEHWPCQREPALIRPARTVLDVDPGDPYAAGRRAR